MAQIDDDFEDAKGLDPTAPQPPPGKRVRSKRVSGPPHYAIRLSVRDDEDVVLVYDPARREPHQWPEQEAARRLLDYDRLVLACRGVETLYAEWCAVALPAKAMSPQFDQIQECVRLARAVLAAEPTTTPETT